MKNGWQTKKLEGWTLLISDELFEKDKAATERALELLTVQLQEITRVVPAAAVAELRKVPLWFSPEYPGVTPRAEYHPGAGWLRENKRDPAMEKAIEFTNVRIFERETIGCPISRCTNWLMRIMIESWPRGSETTRSKPRMSRPQRRVCTIASSSGSARC